MITYRSAGDLGDLIFQLPAIRAFGGGVLFIEAAQYTRQMLTPDKWCGIDSLLITQPYIANVLEWRREHCTINLNDFRAALFRAIRSGRDKEKHLCHWVLDAHGIPRSAMDEAWITVEPNPIASVVFNRTGPGRSRQHVYQNPLFPWHKVWEKYKTTAVFIGSPLEYEIFCATCGEVPYHPTPNLLEAAKVIAGAALFVGNQSVCHAIAEAQKKPIVLEVWPDGPNVLSFRPGVIHGWDQNVVLPDL